MEDALANNYIDVDADMVPVNLVSNLQSAVKFHGGILDSLSYEIPFHWSLRCSKAHLLYVCSG